MAMIAHGPYTAVAARVMARAVVMAAPIVMVTAIPAIPMMAIPDRHRDTVGHGGRGTHGDRGETDETGNKKLLHYILRILSRILIRAWHHSVDAS